MKELKLYISNIDPNLLRTISGRSGELVNLIRAGKYINEKAIEKKLYSGKWSHQNYLNLKSRTKKIIKAYFLISPQKKSNKTLKKMQECRKNYLIGMYFIELFKRREAKRLLEKSYEVAIEYGFTKFAFHSACELMSCASLERKPAKFTLYEKIVEQLANDIQAERKAEQYFYKAMLQMNTKRSVNKDVISDYVSKLRGYSCTSIMFLQYYYTLCIFQGFHSIDYKSVKQVAKKVLGLLKNKKGAYRSCLNLFARTQGIAHTALGEYKQARKLFIEAEKYAPPRSYNLGVLRYYQAVNALHSGDYKEGYRLYRQYKNTKNEILQEQWAVVGAYMYFLKKVGKLDTGNNRFSLGKYLNETIATAHDKAGNNVNVLIGELLVCLVVNRGKFIDRIESIETYSYKHLKGKETRRAKWLIRILCMIPRANFHPATLERIAKRQFDNLEEYPVYMGDNLSVEIIPFDALLKMILIKLNQKAA